jgi:hypothetical protein
VVGRKPRGCGAYMKFLAGCVLLYSLRATFAWGQATAQIHGTVQDSSGAAIAGAQWSTLSSAPSNQSLKWNAYAVRTN